MGDREDRIENERRCGSAERECESVSQRFSIYPKDYMQWAHCSCGHECGRIEADVFKGGLAVEVRCEFKHSPERKVRGRIGDGVGFR
jgi:hypothetical protein